MCNPIREISRWAGPLLSWDQIRTGFAFLTGLSISAPPPPFRLWENPFVCQRTSAPRLQQSSSHNTNQRWTGEKKVFSMACCVRRRILADYGVVSSSLHKGGVLGFACIWVSISCFPPCLCGVSLCPCLLVSAWVGLTYFWLMLPPLHTCNSVKAMNWLTCTR